MNTEEAKHFIQPFYEMLNKPQSKDLTTLSAILAPNWRSYSGETTSKGKNEFIGQVGGFGKIMPDLEWNIKEVFVDGNKIIVRSEVKGTPVEDLFGIPKTGKSFAIMTIDIHTVEGNKLIAAHHVEDWAGAMKQLTAK